MPAAHRGNSRRRWATVAIVSAFVGETPVFQATSAGTDRAAVAPHSSSWSISATMSTMRPSIALRCPVSSANSSNNTSSRSVGRSSATTATKAVAIEAMTPSHQRGTTSVTPRRASAQRPNKVGKANAESTARAQNTTAR